MSIEAMKLALEALEGCYSTGDYDEYQFYDADLVMPAITALRQAIQESSENGLYREGYRNGYGFGEAAGLRQAIEQAQKQEPVAWLDPWTQNNVTLDYDAYGERGIPLYTSPPQRQPRGHAGITIWGGDATVTKVFTETEMKFAREPRRLIENVVGQCLDELAAHGIKGEA